MPLDVISQQGNEVLLVSKEYRTRFRCDGMLLIEGEYYILEIKTERGQQAAKRTGPAEKHYLQGVAYAMLLDVKKIMWVYEGRDLFRAKAIRSRSKRRRKSKISLYIKNIIANVNTPENLPAGEGCKYSAYNKYRKMYLAERKRKEMEKSMGSGTGILGRSN